MRQDAHTNDLKLSLSCLSLGLGVAHLTRGFPHTALGLRLGLGLLDLVQAYFGMVLGSRWICGMLFLIAWENSTIK